MTYPFHTYLLMISKSTHTGRIMISVDRTYFIIPVHKQRGDNNHPHGFSTRAKRLSELYKFRQPHCGLVTPCDEIDLGQHWFGEWLGAWGHQAITWTNVDYSSARSCGIPWGNFTSNAQDTYHFYLFENDWFKVKAPSPRGHELTITVPFRHSWHPPTAARWF